MKPTLRRAQLIQTFGVGAVFSAGGETYVVKDTRYWPIKKSDNAIDFPRLSNALGKRLISYKSEADSREFVPVARFPRWHFCTSCKSLTISSIREDMDSNDVSGIACKKCNSNKPMNPMRFIAYCDNGHLSEINWWMWAHKNKDNNDCKVNDSLYYDAGGKAGGDFNEMVVGCRACNAKADLAGITSQSLSKSFIFPFPEVSKKTGQKCCGSQPWLKEEDRLKADECNLDMRVEMRGSATLYRPSVLSALDIRSEPQFSRKANKLELKAAEVILKRINKDYRGELQNILIVLEGEMDDEEYQGYLDDLIEDAVAFGDFNVDENTLRDLIIYELRKSLAIEEKVSPIDLDDDIQSELYSEEYELFSKGKDVDSDNLVVHFSECTNNIFKRIGQVKWLREIRVFTGFKRGVGAELVPPDIFGEEKWLPAIEAIGEGIYYEINDALVNDWIKASSETFKNRIIEQLERLDKLQGNFHLGINTSELFLIAHTLSHLIMRDLTFRSGYSSSALRERIYIDDKGRRAGILIYTTDTDSEGTLGGLVDQGRMELLPDLLESIKQAAGWCSADPICRENSEQGVEGTNDSACHCCSLVSETSCPYQNSGLNRILLSGLGPKYDEPLGLFTYMNGDK